MAPARRTGTDARLQLRDALAGLEHADLQQQSVFACETLLRQADGPVLDFFLKEMFQHLAECTGSSRRLRYRLGAHALRDHPWAEWGVTLLHVRDRLVDRVGNEDHAAAAAQMQAFAQQLTASLIDAYCHGHYNVLGYSSKAEVPRDWLSELLITPLLKAACRGPARTRVANACLLVHGVLLEFGCWAKSGGVLHAAVDCLKQLLKLTSAGALALSAGEALLPLQSCVALLGSRLKAAALEGILQLCTQAMQRSEWQVRKAAADTLAILTTTLLAGKPVAAAAASRGQQQGLAALETIAPAMAAAVEQHIKYDRIPQVRQAAAALLQQLHRLPGLQQEQRPPAYQMLGSMTDGPAKPGSGLLAAVAAADAAHNFVSAAAAAAPPASHGAASPKGLGRCRGSLQAIIEQRRQQLKQSGWQQQAPVELSRAGGGGKVDGARQAAAACHGRGSSTGSADGCNGGGADDRIRAWAGGDSYPEPQLAAPDERGQQSRPPSADIFQSTTDALQRLQAPQQQQQSRRRGWGSQPALPTRQGDGMAAGRDVPVQVFAPPPLADVPGRAAMAAAGQQQVWRENPLAQSAEDTSQARGAGAAATAAAAAAAAGQIAGVRPAAAVPCVHYIEHPQFALRLQSAPPEANLRLTATCGSQQPPALSSIRFWAQGSDGADVGVEFAFAAQPGGAATAGLHRYWLHQGQLHQQNPSGGSRAGGGAGMSGADPPGVAQQQQQQQTPVVGLPPFQQHAHVTTAELLGQQWPAPTGQAPSPLPAESPLASLATAALPSFSPVKPAAASSVPRAAALAATGGTPGMTVHDWEQPATVDMPSSSDHSLGQPPACVRSGSPVVQHNSAAVRWAASLRPPGEQLLPGLPDWDRRSTGGGGSCGGSRPGSPAAPAAGGCGSRVGSRPASPSRLSRQQWPHGGTHEQQHQHQQRVASSHPLHPQQCDSAQDTAGSRHTPDQDHFQPDYAPGSSLAGEAAAGAAWHDCVAEQLKQQHQQQQQQNGVGGSSSSGPGPLTAMVNKAVSKLQQLHDLQEELQLPSEAAEAAGGAGDAADNSSSSQFGAVAHQHWQQQQQQQHGARHQDQQQKQQQQQLNPRRSLEPVLSAILESSFDDYQGTSSSSSSSSQHADGKQPRRGSSGMDSSNGRGVGSMSGRQHAATVRQHQQQHGEQGQGEEMGRLRRLQEQLQLNMAEIEKRIEEQEEDPPYKAAEEVDGVRAAYASEEDEGMPAAWDAQEQLPAPGQRRHRYHQDQQELPGQHEGAQQQQQRGPQQPASSPGPGRGGGRYGGSRLSPDFEAAAADSQQHRDRLQKPQQQQPEAGTMLAVDNPLFGDSRPGTAQGMQRMHDMLPPKHSLRPPWRTSSQEESGAAQHAQQEDGQRNVWGIGSSNSQQAAAGLGGQQQLRRRQSPQLSGGPVQSLGSLGSGFGVLRHESEVEVQQFLRGSLAAPHQQQQQQLGPAPTGTLAAALRSSVEAGGQLLGSKALPPAVRAAAGWTPSEERAAANSGDATSGSSGGDGGGLQPATEGHSPGQAAVRQGHGLRSSWGGLADAAPAQQLPAAQGGAAGAASEPAGRRHWYGSLDLAAILGSRPASPEKLLRCSSSSSSSSSGGDEYQTVGSRWPAQTSNVWQSGGSSSSSEQGDDEEHLSVPALPQHPPQHQHHHYQPAGPAGAAPAVAELELLVISSRPASPDGPAARRGPPGGGGGGSSSLAGVARQSFPADAVARLQQLKSQLSPARQAGSSQSSSLAVPGGAPGQHARQRQQEPAGTGSSTPIAAHPRFSGGDGHSARSRSPSPKRLRQTPGAVAEAPGSVGSSGRQLSPRQQQQLQHGQQGGNQSSSSSSSRQGSPVQTGATLLSSRPASPELPGLGISRRQARMLQSAVGRMAGNPGEAADAAAIQAALMDVLQQHTADVQAHYQQAAARRLALLRQQHGHNQQLLARALAGEAPLLEQAQEAAVHGELNAFVEQALPRLAEVLSSKEMLLQCFEAAGLEGYNECFGGR